MVALLVSISNITAPSRISSPSLTYHAAIVPSLMSMSTRGRITSVGISLSPGQHALRGGHDVVDLRHRGFLQHGGVGQAASGPAEPHHGCVEIVEGIALADDRGDFGTDPQLLHALVY